MRALLLAIAVFAVGCSHLETVRRMDSREVATGLLRLEIDSAQLEKTVMQRGLESKTFNARPLREDIRYSAELLKRAVGTPGADPTLLGAAQAGLNITGLEYDLLRTDVEATSRGVDKTVRSSCALGLGAVQEGMAALRKDPAWATREVLELNRVLVTAEDQRDAVMTVAPKANALRAGVTAAQIASGALALKTLVQTGPAALSRLIAWLRGARGEMAMLEFAAVGANGVGARVISSAGALTLTDAEVIALAQVGQLSATAVSLYMLANGKPPKVPDPKAFENWARSAPKRLVKPGTERLRYQIKQCGPEEALITSADGKVKIWADGTRAADSYLLEAKFVGAPETSPYIEGSTCNAEVRAMIRGEMVQEFEKYAAVIRDPNTPAMALEVVINDARAVAYFEGILNELGIPGHVIVRL